MVDTPEVAAERAEMKARLKAELFMGRGQAQQAAGTGTPLNASGRPVLNVNIGGNRQDLVDRDIPVPGGPFDAQGLEIDPARPMLANDDGSFSTERGITVNEAALNNGRWTNIPSIVNGRVVSQDEAVRAAVESGQEFPSFDTGEEAVAASIARSERINEVRRPDNLSATPAVPGQIDMRETPEETAARKAALKALVLGGDVFSQPEPEERKPGSQEDLDTVARQAMAFGYGDEWSGAMEFGVQAAANGAEYMESLITGADAEFGDPGQAYLGKRDAERERIAQARSRLSPGERLKAELTGGAITSALTLGRGPILAGGVKLATAAAPKIVGWAQAIKQGIKQGSIWGGVAGLGYSDRSLVDQKKNVAFEVGVGALAGAGLGGLVPVGVSAVTKGLGGVASLLKNIAGKFRGETPPTRADARAMKDILAAFEDDGISPAEMTARLAEWEKQGSAPASLVDLGGESVATLVRELAKLPGVTRRLVQQDTTGRLSAVAENIADTFTSTISVGSGVLRGTNFRKGLEDLSTLRQGIATPLYKLAYETTDGLSPQMVPITGSLKAILKRGSGKTALNNAIKIIDEGGGHVYSGQKAVAGPENLKRMGFVEDAKGNWVIGRELSVEALDYIKRGFDDIFNAVRDSTTYKIAWTDLLRAKDTTRKQYLAELDKTLPLYATARQAWSSTTETMNAMIAGSDIFKAKMTPDVFADIVKGLGEADMEFLRAGVVSAVIQKLHGTPSGAKVVKRLLDATASKQKISSIFDTPLDAKRFFDAINQELRRVETGIAIDPGKLSPNIPGGNVTDTLARLSGRLGQEVVRGDKGLVDVVTSGVGRMLEKGLRSSEKTKLNEQVTEEMARKLLDTQNLSSIIKQLGAAPRAGRGQPLFRSRLGGMVAGNVSGAEAVERLN